MPKNCSNCLHYYVCFFRRYLPIELKTDIIYEICKYHLEDETDIVEHSK